MPRLGFNLYLLFVASWFLRLPARVPVLGSLRIDLLLVLAMAVIAFMQPRPPTQSTPPATDRILRVLLAYAILTIPFVEWPGSVIKNGLPNLIKAVVFYYFTIAFITTEKDLRKFILLFVGCQIFRVLEPLYLHLTQGYWGNAASMEGGAEVLYRLSGGPYDTINPNGLAFVICTTIPFLYFLSGQGKGYRIAFLVLTPACLYALSLTGSRSGLVGLAIVAAGIFAKSRHKVALSAAFVTLAVIGFSSLSSDMQDRYLSLIGMGEKNAETAVERFEGAKEQFHVFLHRPFFGHGLGTSGEANYHFSREGPYAGRAIPAHNLYLELAQELGIFGVIIFTVFLVTIATAFVRSQRTLASMHAGGLLPALNNAMQVWLAMSFVFSVASYGLSSYDWYLFAGLSVIILKLAGAAPATTHEAKSRRRPLRPVPRRHPTRYGRPAA